MVIYKNNMKRMFRSKAKLIVVFLIPVFFALLFMTDNNGTKVSMVILDYDKTSFTEGLIKALETKNRIIMTDETLVKDLLIDGQVDYVITFDQGFTKGLLDGDDVKINELYFIEGGKIQPTRGYIQSTIQIAKNIVENTDSDAAFYAALESNLNSFIVKNVFVEEKSTEESISGIGFMVQFIIYMSVITAAFLLIDKEKNTLLRIITSSVSKKRYMVESLLSFMTIAILQIISIFTFLKVVMHLYFGEHFINLFILMIFFSITAIALAMVIVTLVKSEKMAYGIIMIAATPLTMLGGCYFPISTMPDIVQKISKFLPTTWVMSGAQELIVNNNISSICVNYVVLLTFALTFFIISIVGVKNIARN